VLGKAAPGCVRPQQYFGHEIEPEEAARGPTHHPGGVLLDLGPRDLAAGRRENGPTARGRGQIAAPRRPSATAWRRRTHSMAATRLEDRTGSRMEDL